MRLTPRTRKILAVTSLVVTLTLDVIITFLIATGRGTPEDIALGLAFPALAAVGTLTVLKRPENRVGLVLAAAGVLGASSGPGSLLTPQTAADVLALSRLEIIASVLGIGAFMMFLALLLGILPMLYPTGETTSPGWARVLRWLWGLLLSQLIVVALAPEACFDVEGAMTSCVANPMGVWWFPPMETALYPTPIIVLLGLSAGVVRYRRADRVERLQLKWVVFALGLVLTVLVVPVRGDNQYLLGLVVLMIPVAIGIAITRYRLFEIDRLVSRTLTFVLVVGMLGALYASLTVLPFVLVVGADEGAGEGSPGWLTAAATLAVFSLIRPLHRRVRHNIERRFNRSRYDTEQVIESFLTRVGDMTDAGLIVTDMASSVGQAMSPSRLGVWVDGS